MAKPLRFDLADLRLFIAIVEQGSLSKAANVLPLALSAASARLKGLEERLGLELFKREPRGVSVTIAGQHFYDHAVRLVKAAYDAQTGMDALSGKGRIRLKLWSNTTGLSTELSRQLGEFLQFNPEIDIDVEQHSSRNILKAVAAGKADLGVVDGDYSQRDLLYLLYLRNELVAIAHPENQIAEAAKCRFNEWLLQPLVGYETDSSLQQFIQRMAVIAHSPAQFRATAPSFSAVSELVAKNVGVAILPKPIAARFAKNLPIKIIELDEPWADRELHICLRPQTDTRLPALKLARFLAGVV